jgi:hypothetical protein
MLPEVALTDSIPIPLPVDWGDTDEHQKDGLVSEREREHERVPETTNQPTNTKKKHNQQWV